MQIAGAILEAEGHPPLPAEALFTSIRRLEETGYPMTDELAESADALTDTLDGDTAAGLLIHLTRHGGALVPRQFPAETEARSGVVAEITNLLEVRRWLGRVTSASTPIKIQPTSPPAG